MREAKNVEPKSDHPKELPLDPLNHVVRKICVRIPEQYSSTEQISEQ